MHRYLVLLLVSGLVLSTAARADNHTLKREQVIKRGDRICYDLGTMMNAARKRNGPYDPFETHRGNAASLLTDWIKGTKRIVRRFERLKQRASAEGKPTLRRYIRGLRGLIPRYRRARRAAKFGTKRQFLSRMYELSRYPKKYRRHAERYGFRRC